MRWGSKIDMWDMGVMIFNGDTEGQGALLLRAKSRRDVFLKEICGRSGA